jgi:glutaredoxin
MAESEPVVYATSWCGNCSRTKRFLDEHRVAYCWIDTEHNREAEALVRKVHRGNLATQIAKVLPTYYVAEGVYNASQGLGSSASNMLDISVSLGSTIALLLVSPWLLRRQAAVLGTI